MTASFHWAVPGARCVCIDDDWFAVERGGYAVPTRQPMIGEVLTVRSARRGSPDSDIVSVGEIYLDFWEIPVQQRDGPLSAIVHWLASQFRPLVEEETDISVFASMLGGAPAAPETVQA
ncbi:hypothetical protein ABE438_17525 [Bosea sp. TWI1241]|uniref:hypothetical protein n=1 Tax=Bosea sp. TWI1241 TaxID=3148904 RepID=UPI00320802F5